MQSRNHQLARMERYLRTRLSENPATQISEFRPSLTISRQCGIGIERIGEGLIEYLDEFDDSTRKGWGLFNQALVSKVIEGRALPDSVEPFLGERAKFPVVGCLDEILALNRSEWSLFHFSTNVIRKLCRMGNVIIIGRAGNYVTTDLSNTFHVRLIGSEKKRIDRTKNRYQISEKEAQKMVQELDKGRARLVKRYTGGDISDPEAYHVVLNTDDFSEGGLVRTLADTLLEWASARMRDYSQ